MGNSNYLTTLANCALGYSDNSDYLKNIITLVKTIENDDMSEINYKLTQALIKNNRKGYIAQNLFLLAIIPMNELIKNNQIKEAYDIYINTKYLLIKALNISLENNVIQKVKKVG